MGEAIGQTLPLAVGVAISPIGIIAAVVMLTTDRRAGNGFAFLFGWFAGLMIFGGVLLILNKGADANSGGSPADWTGYGKIALGIVLLFVARRQRRKKRPGDGDGAELPGWLERIQSFGPVQTVGAAFALSAFNPKNLVLILAAATAISQTGASSGDQALALLVFSLIASIGAATPLGIYLFMGDRADPMLGRLKDSMSRNNGIIMAVICVVIAAKLIGDGITTLSLF